MYICRNVNTNVSYIVDVFIQTINSDNNIWNINNIVIIVIMIIITIIYTIIINYKINNVINM